MDPGVPTASCKTATMNQFDHSIPGKEMQRAEFLILACGDFLDVGRSADYLNNAGHNTGLPQRIPRGA